MVVEGFEEQSEWLRMKWAASTLTFGGKKQKSGIMMEPSQSITTAVCDGL